MDKAEYKVKLEEINYEAEQGNFREAAAIAEGIDWRHVKSVRTLVMIGEIYQADKLYERSWEILKIAYKRSATSKTVLLRLAELSIRLKYYDEAKKYINEFEQISPNDTSRYLLRYKLLHARKASIDDQIEVLREYKNSEYSERWAYELARLYKKNDQNDKCIEECDDMILWFSEGRYVQKALDLKASIAELTPAQQALREKLAKGSVKVERNLAEPGPEVEEEQPDPQLNAMEVVEKAMLTADEEEDEARTKMTAGEAIFKLDAAAGAAVAENKGPIQEENDEDAEDSFDEDEDLRIFQELEIIADSAEAKKEAASEQEKAESAPEGGTEREPEAEDVEDDDDSPLNEIKSLTARAEQEENNFQNRVSRRFRNVFDGFKKSIRLPSGKKDAEEAVRTATDEAAKEEAAHKAENAAEEADDANDVVIDLFGEENTAAEAGSKVSEAEAEASEAAAAENAGAERDFLRIFSEECANEEQRTEETGEKGSAEAGSGYEGSGIEEFGKEESGKDETAGAEAANEEEVINTEPVKDPLDDFDLEKLLAETAGSLASEVASGSYVLADTLEDDRAEAERAAMQRRSDRMEQMAQAAQVDVSGKLDLTGVQDVPSDESGERLRPEAFAETDESEMTDLETYISSKTKAAEEDDEEPEFSDEMPDEVMRRLADEFIGELPQESDREDVDPDALIFTAEAEEAGTAVYEEASGENARDDDLDGALIRDEVERLLAGVRSSEDAPEQKAEDMSPEEAVPEEPFDAVLTAAPAQETGEVLRAVRGETLQERAEEPAGEDLFGDEAQVVDFEEDELSELDKANADEEVRKALLADEEELPEIPEEGGGEDLINLSTVEEAKESEFSEEEIIEHLIVTKDYFTRVPVEGRPFTAAEKMVASYFGSIPGIDLQVTSAVADIHNNSGDKTSVSGNVLLMGRQGSGKTRLAEILIQLACLDLGLKAVKSAIVIADEFNKKDPAVVVKKLAGGFLVIEAAGSLSEYAVENLNRAMEFRTDSLVVILEDEKADLMKMLRSYPEFAEKFTSKITVPVFTNDELVQFGSIYARESQYCLDELAALALYTRIGENQKDSEPVTVGAVKAMVDHAIMRSKRRFRFGKAERDGGLIILREKDFNF